MKKLRPSRLRNSNVFVLLILVFISTTIFSQTFIKLPDVELKGGYLGNVSWCDFNSDGYQDIMINGKDFEHPMYYPEFHINNGDNTWEITDIDYLLRSIYGDIDWGDMDNDGLPDLIYAGTQSGFCAENITKIYRNAGNDSLTEVNHSIPALSRCHLEWVDVDNDGWQDIYYHGINAENEFDLGIHKNLGDGIFEAIETNIEKISGPRGNFTRNTAVWADYDNDGFKDVVIAMSSQEEFKYVFYKNNGDFTFELIDIGLPQLNYLCQAAGDINQDGLIDLVFAGSDKLSLSSIDMNADVYIFINQGDLVFTEASKINNVGVFWNNMELGDFSNDGFMDLMVYGTNSQSKVLRLFVNNEDNTFSNFPHSIEDAAEGAALFSDFDNDNDLDIMHSGRFTFPNDYEATYLYENTDTTSNQIPLAPDTLDVFAVNNDILLSWSNGRDDHNLSGSLYYNLRFGIEDNPDALISPFSMDGKLKVNNLGNCNQNKDYYYRTLPEGNFQFNVQTIDHAYNASQFSEAFEFCFKHTQHMFPDTIFSCTGETVMLQVGGDYAGYRWSTSEYGPEIAVTQTGLYNVNLIHLDLCISSETTYVYFYPTPVVNLGPDTILCHNESMVLDAGNPGCAYWWSSGSSTSTLLINGSEMEPGIYDYSVEVLNEYGCVGIDAISIEVVPVPSVDLGADTSIYLNDTLVLFAGNPGANYVWSDGSSADSLVIFGNQPEPVVYDYWVKVTNENNCSITDTIAVTFMGDAGVDKLLKPSWFSIAPNPAGEWMQIHFTEMQSTGIEIQIINREGETVFLKKFTDFESAFTIDVSDLSPGLYFIRVSNGDKIGVQKLLIR